MVIVTNHQRWPLLVRAVLDIFGQGAKPSQMDDQFLRYGTKLFIPKMPETPVLSWELCGCNLDLLILVIISPAIRIFRKPAFCFVILARYWHLPWAWRKRLINLPRNYPVLTLI